MIFSVILCVNEDNPFLDKAINSILVQDYDEFEFIIVANNCTDELYEKLKLSTKDKRIRLFRTIIGQLSFNLNFAINLSKGDYIIRMDSDDVSLPNRLSKCNDLVIHKYDIVGFSVDLINEKDEIIGEQCLSGNKLSNIMYKNPFVHPATMIKRSFLVSCKGYLGGFQSEDYDLWIRAYRKGGVRTHFSEEKVLNYRIRDGQSRGNLLPYCEVASYFYRELLLHPNLNNLASFIVATGKRLFYKFK
ncbi:glycosyl transferase family 2 [Photobacterium frigidiphilum]|uniref:Glycosyl transferase family 2 n=1 Tax=Photobacterium frigidiphilum TaxID=264736 RepID=A0A2T3JPD1_9GAMM|nr:glycosyltransferase [Photobacterium frigidiphilum]PSU50913.1 glycosyl transferase family 2 [Photobacterium frigidiphilum]